MAKRTCHPELTTAAAKYVIALGCDQGNLALTDTPSGVCWLLHTQCVATLLLVCCFRRIQDAYCDLRQKQDARTLPVTARLLETLIRLSTVRGGFFSCCFSSLLCFSFW